MAIRPVCRPAHLWSSLPPSRLSKMRIGMVCYSGLGGSGIVATELAARLVRRGHQVILIATQKPFRFSETSGVRFFGVDLPNYPVFPGPLYTLSLAGAIKQVVREEELELIHTHYAVPHAVSAQLAASGVPLVHTMHGTDVNLLGLDPAFRSVTTWALLQAAATTVVSRFLAGAAKTVYGIHSQVIYNAVDIDRFFPRPELRARYVGPGEALLVHASNFRPIKRVPDIIRAFSNIVKNIPARLLLLGDGPEKPAAEREAALLGVTDRVRFLPATRHPEQLISAADLFLLHSQEESFGLAAAEALASGVPVVAAKVGGLCEVIKSGQTGLLVELGDVVAQGEAVLELLNDPRLPQIRQAAMEDARRRFDPELITIQYERLYQSVLSSL